MAPADAERADDESGAESEAKATVLKSVVLVSPAMREANNGNWHTAHRWAQFLQSHCDIALLPAWPPEAHRSAGQNAPSAMIALHARRSAASIDAWAKACPGKPLIVVLTGTDLYRDIAHDAAAQRSLELASSLIVLQDDGLQAVPEAWRHKARVIYQSAKALKPAIKPRKHFRVLMVGHLRPEKGPVTFMQAARRVTDAGIYFDQIGDALDAGLAQQAGETQAVSPNYRWLGGLPRAATRQRIKRAHLLVNCSLMEGGAHVILEAVQSGTPVLASRISGNIGMLGADYAGYFPVGDADALAALVLRCRNEPHFLAYLSAQCERRGALFEPAAEKRSVLNLVLPSLDFPGP